MALRRTRLFCSMPMLPILLSVFLLYFASGISADGNVTMGSLTIFKTHEWFGRKPTVYFRCHNEKKVYLPDVHHKNQEYVFMGHESFQPLTTLHGEKCKRCGLYEQDTIKGDDTFYEAELCPADFAAPPEGQLFFFKEKELNASLLCPDCIPRTAENQDAAATTNTTDTASGEEEDNEEDDKGATAAILIITFIVIILVALGVVAYSKWRQKQRREQQARFVRLFGDDDDLDAELGLKDDDL